MGPWLRVAAAFRERGARRTSRTSCTVPKFHKRAFGQLVNLDHIRQTVRQQALRDLDTFTNNDTTLLRIEPAFPRQHRPTTTHPRRQLKMDVIRSTLQPITHNLPAPIRELGISLLGGPCYETLLIDIDPTNQECLKLAVSKGLGLGIVAASSIVKVPQILKLASSGSAEGVSFLSYLLETAAYLIGLAYNFRNGFPFSTYGETALILVQNVVISVLVLKLSGRAGLAAVFVAGLAGLAGALFSEAPVDMKMLGYLQAGAGTLGVASKVPQILAIWREGGTGQLSAFTVSPHTLTCYPTPHIFPQNHKLT